MAKYGSSTVLGVGAAVAVLLAAGIASAQPVLLSTRAVNGTDTSYFGLPLEMIFHLDANGVANIAAVNVPMELHFSNGNILGPVGSNQQFFWLPAADVFELKAYSGRYADATDPDTIFFVPFSGAPPDWNGAGDICKIVVLPLDTGQITFTDVLLPPANVLSAITRSVVEHDVEWNAPTIVVEPCPSELMGDVDASGDVAAVDVIYLIGHIFRGGPEPLPRRLAGDADCSRSITAADIIWLVNFAFKSGPPPCPCSNAGL